MHSKAKGDKLGARHQPKILALRHIKIFQHKCPVYCTVTLSTTLSLKSPLLNPREPNGTASYEACGSQATYPGKHWTLPNRNGSSGIATLGVIITNPNQEGTCRGQRANALDLWESLRVPLWCSIPYTCRKAIPNSSSSHIETWILSLCWPFLSRWAY